MQITIDLPDELVQHFNRNSLTREILEALVVQAYQTEKITSAEVGRILGLPSRWAVDAFLKQHNADLRGEFEENGIMLSQDSTVLVEQLNKHWQIASTNTTYGIRRIQNQNRLN